MTVPRTIRENAQPGERYAILEQIGWSVRTNNNQDQKYHFHVASGLTEADARLLVFGPKVVEAAHPVFAEEPLENGQHVRSTFCSATAAEFGEACICYACVKSSRRDAERRLYAALAQLVTDKPAV